MVAMVTNVGHYQKIDIEPVWRPIQDFRYLLIYAQIYREIYFST